MLSDIHGNLPALEAVVADMASRGVDGVVNLGDHVSGPLWPHETLEYLMRQEWTQIAGNHDRLLAVQQPERHGLSDRYAYRRLSESGRGWIRSLPAIARLPNDIVAIHGSPSSDATYLLETVEHGRVRLATRAEIALRLGDTRSPVLVCGHTHVPRVVQMPGNMLIVNAGSVGLPAFDDELPEHHVVETGSPHARYAVLELRNDCWAAAIVAVAYEYEKAAEQARNNGRPDWEIALRTGFMRLEAGGAQS